MHSAEYCNQSCNLWGLEWVFVLCMNQLKGPQKQKIMFGFIKIYGLTEHLIVVLFLNKYLERKILMLFGILLHSIGLEPQKMLDWPRPSYDIVSTLGLYMHSLKTPST